MRSKSVKHGLAAPSIRPSPQVDTRTLRTCLLQQQPLFFASLDFFFLDFFLAATAVAAAEPTAISAAATFGAGLVAKGAAGATPCGIDPMATKLPIAGGICGAATERAGGKAGAGAAVCEGIC